MFTKRTDLATEAQELWQESAGKTTLLKGVKAVEKRIEGYPITNIDILDKHGAEALGKPIGRYRTIDFTSIWKHKAGYFERAVRAVGTVLKSMLPEGQSGAALIVGLGNNAITPDAVGSLAIESVLVTRHLIDAMPKQFSGFRPTAVCRPGVLGTTGIESAETVRAIVEKICPDVIIVIDAFVSRRRARLCSTVQLSDSGISPGSGVGNHRAALNQETMGIPVIVIGVPTVIDAVTLAVDILEESGQTQIGKDALNQGHHGLIVTPQDIDAQVRDLSKIIGYGINWALHNLEIEDINALL